MSTEEKSRSSNIIDWEKAIKSACMKIQFGCQGSSRHEVNVWIFRGQWSLLCKSGTMDHLRWNSVCRSTVEEVPDHRDRCIFALVFNTTGFNQSHILGTILLLLSVRTDTHRIFLILKSPSWIKWQSICGNISARSHWVIGTAGGKYMLQRVNDRLVRFTHTHSRYL